ncbi:MAG: MASE1 domain-containing protein [Bacillota bacterium]
MSLPISFGADFIFYGPMVNAPWVYPALSTATQKGSPEFSESTNVSGKQVGSEYGLKWNPNPPITMTQYAVYAIAIGVSIIVSWLGVFAVPIGFAGVSALYIASAFYMVFALWFGGWGILAAYIGCLIGAGWLSGLPVLFSIPWAIADILEPLVPFLLFRYVGPKIGFDPLGRNIFSSAKNILFFFFCGALIPTIISGLFGIALLVWGGIVPPAAFVPAWIAWFAGGTIVITIVAPILLKTLSPVIERFGLTVKGVWS